MSPMRPPKPTLHAIYRARDGTLHMVLEVTDLPFVGQYQLVLASEDEVRNGVDVASITDEEFARICAQRGLVRVTSGGGALAGLKLPGSLVAR